MNKYLLLLLFVTFTSATLVGQAQSFEAEKDTYYFLKGDGEFSDEEKDEEAFYIYQQCSSNIMQRVYFNCECVAGAFRQIRDSDEKLRPQSMILDEIFEDDSRGCINKPAIAGENYRFCLNYANTMRARSKENEGYCTCVANKVADDFGNNPKLKTKNIENLRTDALVSCGYKYK